VYSCCQNGSLDFAQQVFQQTRDSRPRLAAGVNVHPVAFDYSFLALIALEKPVVFQVLTYGYSTLWFTTSFFGASLMMSALAVVA
jgi:hypothetical protein